jgi:hypothetical protein
MAIKEKSFLDLFTDPSPALMVNFSRSAEERSRKILVRNKLGDVCDKKGRQYLESICKDSRLSDFLEFYLVHDGFEFCTPILATISSVVPLLKVIPSKDLSKFTDQYLNKGRWAWTIDLNKSKGLYRGNNKWISFAQIGNGPSCLATFLDGENAGCVYLVAPQPHFNILKPIAKSFNHFLERIAKDPAAFLRLTRSYISIRKTDGNNYGHVPMEYLSDSGDRENGAVPISQPLTKKSFNLFK